MRVEVPILVFTVQGLLSKRMLIERRLLGGTARAFRMLLEHG